MAQTGSECLRSRVTQHKVRAADMTAFEGTAGVSKICRNDRINTLIAYAPGGRTRGADERRQFTSALTPTDWVLR